MSEKRRGQRQLTLFWTLLVGQPATQSVVIHADPGSNRCLGIARFREIPLQRAKQLIRAEYTFLWQSAPPPKNNDPDLLPTIGGIKECG